MIRRVASLGLLALCLSSAASGVEIASMPPDGSPVEVREGDEWSAATFVRKEGRRLLVRYSDNSEEWITADRMRKSEVKGSAATVTNEPVTLEGPFIEIAVDSAPAPKRVSPLAAKRTPATRPAGDFARLSLGETDLRIEKFLSCADSGSIVLGISKKAFADQTRIVRMDLEHPERVEERVIVAPKQKVVGAADGGRLLLTTPEFDGVTIHLWEFVGEKYELKGNYTFVSKKGGRKVNSAFLVSPGRALVCCDGDQNFLVDLESRRAVCMFKTFGRKPELDPTGRLVMVYNNNSAGVLRSSDCGIVAEFAGCGAFQAPTTDPTGTFAAYPQSNGICIARIAGGAQTTVVRTSRNKESFWLLSSERLLVGDVVYDVKTGIPIWRYVVPQGSVSRMLPTGQMLYVLRDSNAACVINLPDARAVETFKGQRPADYLLAPGAQIVVSSGLSLYGAQQKMAEDLVRKAIGLAGHKVATGASAFKLSFVSAPGPTEEQRYMESGYMGPPLSRRVTCPSTIVTATLRRDGKAIWQQTWKHGASGVIMRKGGESLEQAAAEAAKPIAAVLDSLAIPGYIPKGSTAGEMATLGASSITADGFAPAPPTEKTNNSGKPEEQKKSPEAEGDSV